MTDAVDRELERCRRAGEVVALSQITRGRHRGARLLVWPGGEMLGDLGSPRLNQRVALYVEGVFDRGTSARKRFDVPDDELVIETTVYGKEMAGG